MKWCRCNLPLRLSRDLHFRCRASARVSFGLIVCGLSLSSPLLFWAAAWVGSGIWALIGYCLVVGLRHLIGPKALPSLSSLLVNWDLLMTELCAITRIVWITQMDTYIQLSRYHDVEEMVFCLLGQCFQYDKSFGRSGAKRAAKACIREAMLVGTGFLEEGRCDSLG